MNSDAELSNAIYQAAVEAGLDPAAEGVEYAYDGDPDEGCDAELALVSTAGYQRIQKMQERSAREANLHETLAATSMVLFCGAMATGSGMMPALALSLMSYVFGRIVFS
jgi:hypothetical protein